MKMNKMKSKLKQNQNKQNKKVKKLKEEYQKKITKIIKLKKKSHDSSRPPYLRQLLRI